MADTSAPTNEYTIDPQPMLSRLSDAAVDAKIHLQGAALDAALSEISALRDLIRGGHVSPADISQRLQTIRDQISANSTEQSQRTQAEVAQGAVMSAEAIRSSLSRSISWFDHAAPAVQHEMISMQQRILSANPELAEAQARANAYTPEQREQYRRGQQQALEDLAAVEHQDPRRAARIRELIALNSNRVPVRVAEMLNHMRQGTYDAHNFNHDMNEAEERVGQLRGRIMRAAEPWMRNELAQYGHGPIPQPNETDIERANDYMRAHPSLRSQDAPPEIRNVLARAQFNGIAADNQLALNMVQALDQSRAADPHALEAKLERLLAANNPEEREEALSALQLNGRPLFSGETQEIAHLAAHVLDQEGFRTIIRNAQGLDTYGHQLLGPDGNSLSVQDRALLVAKNFSVQINNNLPNFMERLPSMPEEERRHLMPLIQRYQAIGVNQLDYHLFDHANAVGERVVSKDQVLYVPGQPKQPETNNSSRGALASEGSLDANDRVFESAMLDQIKRAISGRESEVSAAGALLGTHNVGDQNNQTRYEFRNALEARGFDKVSQIGNHDNILTFEEMIEALRNPPASILNSGQVVTAAAHDLPAQAVGGAAPTGPQTGRT